MISKNNYKLYKVVMFMPSSKNNSRLRSIQFFTGKNTDNVRLVCNDLAVN